MSNKYLTKIAGKISEKDRLDSSFGLGVYGGAGGAYLGHKGGQKARTVFHNKVTVPNSIKQQALDKAKPIEGQNFKEYMKRIRSVSKPNLSAKNVAKAGRIGLIAGAATGATLGAVGTYKALGKKTKQD